MNEMDDEEFDFQVEVERAMEEIVDKENNMKQLVQVTNSLYERTTDLQK